MDFVKRWSGKTDLAVFTFLVWLGIATSKWHSWKDRYGKANEHNAWIPRDHWLEPQEKEAIVHFSDGAIEAGSLEDRDTLPPPGLHDDRCRCRRL